MKKVREKIEKVEKKVKIEDLKENNEQSEARIGLTEIIASRGKEVSGNGGNCSCNRCSG